MAIHLVCRSCRTNLCAPEDLAGRTARCPKCSATLIVPGLVLQGVQPDPADARPEAVKRTEVPHVRATLPLVPKHQFDLNPVPKREQDQSWAEKARRLKNAECSQDVIRESGKSAPFPAAFREIAIAIRQDIRARRKENIDPRDLLLRLYRWAVIRDFFNRVEWSKIVDERILRSTARPFIKAIKAPYKRIGYANLVIRMTDKHGAHSFVPILKKTDVKWLVEAFGEPDAHSTAQDANPELWQQAVEAFRAASQRDKQQFYRSHGFDGPP